MTYVPMLLREGSQSLSAFMWKVHVFPAVGIWILAYVLVQGMGLYTYEREGKLCSLAMKEECAFA